jgi:capsular exopolysaccharide synthesis family protein
LFEHLDRRIYSTENLEAATSVPVLGSVPIFGVPRRSRGEIALLAGDIQTPASEAFRVLKSIVLSGAEGSCPRTLLIASAEPGAGKSTVLVNLATVMAQAGRRVVVVDSNLRHPCLHRVFELPNKVGLSTVLVNLETVMAQAGREVIVVDGDSRHPSWPGAFQLRNSVGLSNVLLEGGSLSTALRGTKVPGVRVLTSGPLPHYPAELLSSTSMQKVVTALSNSADVVLFDSPPMLAVADAVDLASMVEGVLLVAARGQATGEQLQTVLQQLDRVGARVLGIILNKARRGAESYGYY